MRRNARRYLRRMRALSPAVSAVILIIAAIVGGILVYKYFIGTISAMASKPELLVQVSYDPISKVLYYNIQNVGTVPVNVTKLYVAGCGTITLNKLVAPGASIANVTSITCTSTPSTAIAYYYVPGRTGLLASRPVAVQISA